MNHEVASVLKKGKTEIGYACSAHFAPHSLPPFSGPQRLETKSHHLLLLSAAAKCRFQEQDKTLKIFQTHWALGPESLQCPKLNTHEESYSVDRRKIL